MTERKKELMLEALEKTHNVVTDASKAVGISRHTHYLWMKNDPEYAAAVRAMDEVCLDFAESQLYKLMKNENPTAIIFYLKTKGKDRGYVERSEVVNKKEVIQIEELEAKELEI